MLDIIIKDFINVKMSLNKITGKNIPLWIVIIYYIVIGLLILPITLSILLYCKIRIKYLKKKYNIKEK